MSCITPGSELYVFTIHITLTVRPEQVIAFVVHTKCQMLIIDVE